MKRALALAVTGVAVLSVAGAALSRSEESSRPTSNCKAERVQGNWVTAGPIRGGIAPQYDVVDGRFRLRVGSYRDRATGLNQKIPWFLSRRYRAGGVLRMVGRRLSPSPRTFKQRFNEAGMSGSDDHVFPSIVSPPESGCWRLQFRTGKVAGTLTVWVHGRG
jgi:hypothetical protein